MTRFIADSAWSRFCVESNGTLRYDGILFESLVRDLLTRFFAGVWEQTSRSWDGGRDFVDRSISGGEQWAECKMYRRNVGIRVLSPTLIMAIMERVHSLFIFSFSEVNAPAKRHLARLGIDQKMAVRLYDGPLLDRLILAAPEICARYFGFCDVVERSAPPLWTSGRLTRDLEFELSDLAGIVTEVPARELPIDLFSPVVLEIFLRNQNPLQPLDLELNLDAFHGGQGPLNRMDQTTGAKAKFVLAPGEIRGVRIALRATRAGTHLIPPLQAKTKDTSDNCASFVIPLPIERIKASLIRHPPLVGARYIRDLDCVANAILLSTHFRTALVCGPTGVGKSRYLQELGYRLIDGGRSLVHITPQSVQGLNWREVLRSIVARLCAMPNPLHFGGADTSDDDWAFKENPAGDEVTSFLYGSSDVRDDTFITSALRICSARLKISPRVILLDDIQGFESEIVTFFRELDLALRERACRSALVVGVNIDRINSSRNAGLFYVDLRERFRGSADQTGSLVEIEEFTEGQVDEFVDNLLSAQTTGDRVQFSSDFPQLMALLREKVEPRPLALWQLLHLWIDRGYLFPTERSFVIRDIDGIQASLREAWQFLAGVLAQRVALLRERQDDWVTLQITSLCGDMSREDINDLGLNPASIERLIDAALLKRRGSEGVEFYHDTVARALRKVVVHPDEAVKAFLSSNWSGVPRTRMWQRRPIPAYNLDTLLNIEPLNRGAVIEGCSLTSNPTLPSQRAADRLLQDLIGKDRLVDALPWILGLTRHAGMLDGRAGQTRLLLDLAPTFANFRPSSPVEAMCFSQLIASTASQGLSDGFRNDASVYLERWEVALSRELRSKSASPFARELRARVRNRMCILYKDIGQHHEAARRARQSLRDSPVDRNPFLACLNFVDLGYISYGAFEGRRKTVRNWRRAQELYAQHRDKILEHGPEAEHFVGLVGGLSDAIQGRHLEARERLERVAAIANQKNDVYYQLQATIAANIFALRDALAERSELTGLRQSHLLSGFRALEDRTAALNIRRFLTPIQYAQAICHMAAERPRWGDVVALLDMLLRPYDASAAVSPMVKAISYDWFAAMRQLHNTDVFHKTPPNRLTRLDPSSLAASRFRAMPPITSFWIDGINLPYV